MQHTSEFHGPVDGQYVIPGTHTAAGGTTNFNFGCPPTQERIVRPREPFSTAPFAPDPDFVDRPDIVAWVRDKCAKAGARAALVGLGGVGKSQLALQYAHSIRDANPQTFVFWVHASTRARFEEAYRDIANRLQLPGASDPKVNVLPLVSDWLRDETNGQWVMVLDNVDDVQTFHPSRKRQRDEPDAGVQPPLATFLPQSRNGVILVTSRSKDAAVRLGQGMELLYNKLDNPPAKEISAQLLHALDCIPLAITQAAAYINRRAGMSIARYLDEFSRNSKMRESLLKWDADELRRDGSASNSVVTTWQMSFEQIQRERRPAADLLSLMSFFNPQGIPESTLRSYNRDAAGAATTDDEVAADDAFNENLDLLRAYSLVSMTAESDTCEMHALVQFCTQVWLSSFGDVQHWDHRFIALMRQELPNGDYENWTKCQKLLPHVERLFHKEPVAEDIQKAWAHVLTNAAWYLYNIGSYHRAQAVAIKAVRVREHVLGMNNSKTLDSVSVLAMVLMEQGKYEDAEKLHQQALAGTEKELGEHHPDTLTSLSDLASVLQCQGKYEEAEQLNQRALAGREKELGEHHPSTLTSVNNLALVLQDQGKYKDAEKLHRRALTGWEKELGEHHPDTLTSLSNLASVLKQQGKYKDAEKLDRRALAGREKELGEHHPDTLRSLSNLASVLKQQGKYKDAEKLDRRALAGREKKLGEHHPDTLTSLSHLALVLKQQGKYKDAEKLHRRALAGREKELGEHHPDTLTSVNNLALVLKQQGKYKEAEQLHRRALAGSEKELGEHHLDTLRSLGNLALVLQDQGKYKEAEQLHRRALAGSEKELGEHHPDTLTSLSNLALVLKQQGKYKEAEQLNRRALAGTEKELGEHHPDTLISVNNLAHLLESLKRYSEAAELYQRAYKGRVQMLGSQHPDTIACGDDFSAMQQEAKEALLAENDRQVDERDL
ncbi:TPR domain protein [Phaeosphaeria sp. MPI-PUGE-AT-0046c]|nr:TPR domain protein [Phaeosphaeria sp. MPI-PUGE-AT-0046c]